MKQKKKFNKGYALLLAILAINIFAIFMLRARSIWETELQRDLEEELLFRGKQYVTAIENYMKKSMGAPLKNLDELVEKKFLRKRYKDPMTNGEKWNVVMRSNSSGKEELMIMSEDMMAQFFGQATLVGVASTSCEEGFKIYRKKKKYCEWAIYSGGLINKEMPELKFIGGGGSDSEGKKNIHDDSDKKDDHGNPGIDDGNNDNRDNPDEPHRRPEIPEPPPGDPGDRDEPDSN